MHHAVAALFASVIVMHFVPYYAFVNGGDSWRVVSEPQLLIFRKPFRTPPLKRVAAFVSALFFLILPFWFVSLFPFSDVLSNGLWLLFWGISCWPMAGFFLWVAQPEELRLDLQKQTYHCTRGWSLWSKQWWGEFSDFAGIDVERRGTARVGINYYTRLHWKTPRKRTFTLGIFAKEEDAQRLAEEIRAELWGQTVPAPNQWRHSST